MAGSRTVRVLVIPEDPTYNGYSDDDDRRTSFDERQARREAVTRIDRLARREVAKLRAQGWTKQDFARALRKLLDADVDDSKGAVDRE